MMFDPSNLFSAAPAGQPEPSAAEGQQEQPQGTPENKGLTIEQVTQAIKEQLAEFRRAEQSQRDKFESRVTKSVTQQLETLKAAGIDVTDDVKASLTTATRKAIQQETEAESSNGASPAQGKPEGDKQSAQPADPNEPYYALAAEALKELGVTLDENDPEAAELKKFEGTPYQWVKKVEQLGQAKKARTSKLPQTTTTTATGNTPGNPWAGKDDLDILTEAYRK